MDSDKQLWLDDPYEVESIWYPSFFFNKTIPTKRDLRHHGKLTYSPSNGALLKLYHN